MPRQYHKNPRQITTKQMTMLAHDLAELGDLSGIVHDLNTDELIGGNQRSKIFRLDECEIQLSEQYDAPDEQGTVALGYVIWQGKKYTYRQVRWDTKTAEKANIVANKAGGTWDFDILGNEWEIDELLEWGFEPFELGLDDTEAEEPAEDPGAQVDRAEELREKWGVETGQLWQLGEHRLVVGDCTDAAVVARVMGGERADLGIHDPPYGINRSGQKETFTKNPKHKRKEHADLGWDSERPSKEQFARIIGMSDVSVIWGGNYFSDLLPPRMGWLYWDKGQNGLSMSDGELAWTSENKALRAITVNRAALIESVHPTQKPLSVIEWCINMYAGRVVIDIYSGSGTTLIACEQLGRRCRAVEISPGYVAVALQRWADMTGQTPELVEEKAPTIAGAGK
jgi:site-specific DNA-methyltransferase (adenine-specific)